MKTKSQVITVINGGGVSTVIIGHVTIIAMIRLDISQPDFAIAMNDGVCDDRYEGPHSTITIPAKNQLCSFYSASNNYFVQ